MLFAKIMAALLMFVTVVGIAHRAMDMLEDYLSAMFPESQLGNGERVSKRVLQHALDTAFADGVHEALEAMQVSVVRTSPSTLDIYGKGGGIVFIVREGELRDIRLPQGSRLPRRDVVVTSGSWGDETEPPRAPYYEPEYEEGSAY